MAKVVPIWHASVRYAEIWHVVSFIWHPLSEYCTQLYLDDYAITCITLMLHNFKPDISAIHYLEIVYLFS